MVNNSGYVGVGTTTPLDALHIRGVSESILLESNSNSSDGSADLQFEYSRGTSASKTILQPGDGMGGILFRGWDGIAYRPATLISSVVNAITGNIISGSLVFSTNSGSIGTVVERMRINPSGNVGIGTSTPGYQLDVAGTVNISQCLKTHNATVDNLLTAGSVSVGAGLTAVTVSVGAGLTAGSVSVGAGSGLGTLIGLYGIFKSGLLTASEDTWTTILTIGSGGFFSGLIIQSQTNSSSPTVYNSVSMYWLNYASTGSPTLTLLSQSGNGTYGSSNQLQMSGSNVQAYHGEGGANSTEITIIGAGTVLTYTHW